MDEISDFIFITVQQILRAVCDGRRRMIMDGIKKKIRWKDPGRLREAPKNFHCTEIVEDGDVGTIRFTCTVPPGDECLVFSCRGRSVGMLVKGEEPAEENVEMEFEKVDVNFFDSGYTLAGMTGFQIWSASRLLMEVLTWSSPSSSNNNYYNQTIVGAKIIELGSGIGVVGTSLAYAGGHVLLTDLPTLVENAVIPNLYQNSTQNNASDNTHWKDAIPIGKGWASAQPLDWTKPLSAEHDDTMENIDFIIASDCVWLTSMFHALMDTVVAIFERSPNATFLLSFQQRNTTTSSSMFTSIDSILETLVVQHGWKVQCIAWRPIYQNDSDNDGNDKTEEQIPVFVLEIQQSTNTK